VDTGSPKKDMRQRMHLFADDIMPKDHPEHTVR
jgi:hypothetical protein